MSSDEKRPLGKILLQRKLVSQQELDEAMRAREQAAHAAPPTEDPNDEVAALRALSEQHGIPGIDLQQIAIVCEQLGTLPREVAETHSVLPVLVRADRIFLAMSDPSDKRVIDELEFVTGKKVFSYIAIPATIVKTIAAAYDARERGERYFLGPRVPAETLRQLGLEAPTPVKAAHPAVAVQAESPPPPSSSRHGAGPSRPPVVVDEATEEAALELEISTGEFGEIGEEVSSVTSLPEDLRARTTQALDAVPAGTGKLVLVVDDEEEIRKLVRRLLTQRGFRVVEADRGLLALRLVKDHTPDLIVLDAMLPELHGFDIARRIKGSAKYGRIPIVMISAVYRGWRIAEDLKQNYGVDEYFEKPFKINELMDAVQRLISRSVEETPSGPPRDPEYLSSEAEKALNEGIAAYKAGQIDLAVDHLRRGIAIDPLAYRLHFHLALLFGKRGQIYEGIQELERATELNPRHFPALKNLAVLYEKAAFKNKAVEMWERCISAAPDDDTRASIREHLLKLI